MKRLIIGVSLALLCGCITADRFIAADADPQKGERYKLYFRTLKVVQVCNDNVLEKFVKLAQNGQKHINKET